MPATEEITAAPNAAIGDNLGIGVPSNTGASIATSIAKKKNNVVARMNTNKSKSFKSQAKSQHSHPPYGNMIKAALLAAQDKKGSSRAAILKYIMQNFAVGENPTLVNAHLRMGLKRGVASGVLKQMKGTGASGSFRLVDAKSEPIKKVRKPAVGKSATAADIKMRSPKKSMKTQSRAKKTSASKASKAKAPKKASGVSTSGNKKNKKAVAGRPKKAKGSPVKSKTAKKSTTTAHARNRKVAA